MQSTSFSPRLTRRAAKPDRTPHRVSPSYLLWGKDSFNWGAGMHRINTAANFIRANMPLGKGGSLTVQQAWDVAYYLNSHERPQDPPFKGNIKTTKVAYHQHQCLYGEKVEKHVLGKTVR
jgi:thiosulfate dehydrogenase